MSKLNLLVIGLYALGALILVIWWLVLRGREDNVRAREKIVGQRECACDRRCEIINEAEDDLESRYNKVLRWMNDAVEMTSSYVVTDSDEFKYNTELAIRNVARKRIAYNIASDIINRFDPTEEKNEFGRTKFSYHFKVVEDK